MPRILKFPYGNLQDNDVCFKNCWKTYVLSRIKFPVSSIFRDPIIVKMHDMEEEIEDLKQKEILFVKYSLVLTAFYCRYKVKRCIIFKNLVLRFDENFIDKENTCFRQTGLLFFQNFITA